MSAAFSEIHVEQVAEYLRASGDLSASGNRSSPVPPDLAGEGGAIQLIDVREPQELEMASLDGFLNYPLGSYGEWAERILTELDPQAETWVLCHHGMRSAQMCQWLSSQGFTQVKNITGGIDAYSARVDRTVPRY
jgi:rhodanese-related sulfurtransferase